MISSAKKDDDDNDAKECINSTSDENNTLAVLNQKISNSEIESSVSPPLSVEKAEPKEETVVASESSSLTDEVKKSDESSSRRMEEDRYENVWLDGDCNTMDEFRAFCLVTRLSSHFKFNQLWPVMVDLGWKYSTCRGSYVCPSSKHEFASSKELCDVLDRATMPPRSFRHTNQILESQTRHIFHHTYIDHSSTFHEQIQLRQDILRALFQKQKFNSGQYQLSTPSQKNQQNQKQQQLVSVSSNKLSECTHTDNHDNHNHNQLDSDKGGHNYVSNNSNIMTDMIEKVWMKKIDDNQRPSATSIEPGAEQYLSKKKRPKRSTRNVTTNTILSEESSHPLSDQNSQKDDSNIENKNNQSSILLMDASKLVWKNPKQCVQSLRKKMKPDDEKSSYYYSEREKEARKQFPHWKFQLSTNHSLLLYGFGSKETLLNDFCKQELLLHHDELSDNNKAEAAQVLTLRGYDLQISIEKILNLMVQCFVEKKHQSQFSNKTFQNSNYKRTASSRNQQQQQSRHKSINDGHRKRRSLVNLRVGNNDPNITVNETNKDDDVFQVRNQHWIIQKAVALAKFLANTCDHPIYLVLHNIDGLTLQNPIAQSALSALIAHSQIPNEHTRIIRLIASVDHVNASILLWDTETNANFSWIWKLVNTHRPYYNEIEFGVLDSTPKLKQTQKKNFEFISRSDAVLKSLAPRHAEILQTLAKIQLEGAVASNLNDNKKKNIRSSSSLNALDYVPFQVLKKRCPFTNEKDLRSMMRELLDHRIIITKRHEETSKEMVVIPASLEKLNEIVALKKKL